MSVKILEEENRTVAVLSGEIDHQNIREVVMDFSGTDFMDSSGIGMMMGRYRAVQRNGGHMRAEHVNDRVKKILDMAGIGKLIEISKA